MKNEFHKSHADIMSDLTQTLLNDVCELHSMSPRECNIDKQKIKHRSQFEGAAFFTKTLPDLAKSIDKALLGSQLNVTSFKLRRGTKLPLFLNGLFKLVFSDDGYVLEQPDTLAVRSLRQVGFVFYKYELPYTEATTRKSIKEFFEDDVNLSLEPSVELSSTIYYAQQVLNEIFNSFSFKTCAPKNGPGSVSNCKHPWERFRPYKFYQELDDLVPYPDMFAYNEKHLFDCFDEILDLNYADRSTTKLIVVPKDSRGPRLISSEPSEKMTYQQNLKRALYPFIEHHPLIGGQVNFTDQTINGSLALEGSRTGDLATLDLSKASDLLSLELVDWLFEDTCIHEYLMKSRSSHISYDSQTRRLRKYGPMGNALTFPIEALSFYSLIVGSMIAQGVPRNKAYRSVWVYGDDIILPTLDVETAISALEIVGLRVNEDKSCFSGCFRESCGVDACMGVDVTPIKIKKVIQQPGITTISSYVAYSNELFWLGYWNLSRRLIELIDPKGTLPFVTKDSPLIGVETWSLDQAIRLNKGRRKWNRHLQRYEIKGVAIRPLLVKPKMNGWEQLMNFAWNAGEVREDYSFSTGTFAVRHAAKKFHAVVGEHSV